MAFPLHDSARPHQVRVGASADHSGKVFDVRVRADDRIVKVAASYYRVRSDDTVSQATVIDDRPLLHCDVRAEDARDHTRACFHPNRFVYLGRLHDG